MYYTIYTQTYDTVDGWNPKQPPGMFETLFLGYLPYQLVQDSSHQYIPPWVKRNIIFKGSFKKAKLLVLRKVYHISFIYTPMV